MSTTPTPEIPAKCPECGYSFRPLSEHINHSSTCSRIDLDSARHYLRRAAEQTKRETIWMMKQRERAMLWEGKFHIVRHENNKLRKENRLLAIKQPPKDPTP